jgi:hypothetical protein
MGASNDQLRAELERKFQPPIDVLLDPSLVVARRSVERLADSAAFTSQKQATLGRTPTKPRLGDLYVPETFTELFSNDESTIQKTDVWDFYRGQAETAFRSDVIDLIDRSDINPYSGNKSSTVVNWANAVGSQNRQDRLPYILAEEFSFLQSGGLVLSRTATTFNIFRDAGVPTIHLGGADLVSELRETLTDIGYKDPAGVCAFGVSTADSTVDALAANVLDHHFDFLLYQLGD